SAEPQGEHALVLVGGVDARETAVGGHELAGLGGAPGEVLPSTQRGLVHGLAGRVEFGDSDTLLLAQRGAEVALPTQPLPQPLLATVAGGPRRWVSVAAGELATFLDVGVEPPVDGSAPVGVDLVQGVDTLLVEDDHAAADVHQPQRQGPFGRVAR